MNNKVWALEARYMTSSCCDGMRVDDEEYIFSSHKKEEVLSYFASLYSDEDEILTEELPDGSIEVSAIKSDGENTWTYHSRVVQRDERDLEN